jgi:hypothetical protein
MCPGDTQGEREYQLTAEHLPSSVKKKENSGD